MTPLTSTHEATGTHRGWPVAYIGPDYWAALDSQGRVLWSGGHDSVMRGIDTELRGDDR